jgi:malate synthase
MVRKLLAEEVGKVRTLVGEAGWNAGEYAEAARLFERITTADDYVEFLTLPGYDWLVRQSRETVPA